jgi:DNA-binding response OmpR family regulator
MDAHATCTKAVSAILVVDQDQATREMIAAVLDDQHYQVVVCGETSAPDIEALAPALIILELRPQDPARGLSLIRQLRRAERTIHTPIIVTSTDSRLLCGHNLDGQRCALLPKPFDLEELLTSVYGAIGCSAPSA